MNGDGCSLETYIYNQESRRANIQLLLEHFSFFFSFAENQLKVCHFNCWK